MMKIWSGLRRNASDVVENYRGQSRVIDVIVSMPVAKKGKLMILYVV